ncbi:MAG: hypothetical protein ACE5NP_10275 [Anaerolineae bacterium]
MPVKLDACSLIYLVKAGSLDLVERVHGKVLITEAVYQEAVVAGKRGGYADALVIEQAIAAGKVKVVALKTGTRQKLAAAQVPARLGTGEKETIFEALEEGCLAVLDDLDSRAVASSLGVTLCGSDTVLVEALLKKVITRADYETKVTRLAGVMGMRADDLAEASAELGRSVAEAGSADRGGDRQWRRKF